MKNNGKYVGKQSRKINRRKFISSSAAAAAAFTIVPRSVMGGLSHTTPNEKVNLAFIGVGDQGMGNLNELMNLDDVEVVAVCDVAKIVDYSRQEFGATAGLDDALRNVEHRYSDRAKFRYF